MSYAPELYIYGIYIVDARNKNTLGGSNIGNYQGRIQDLPRVGTERAKRVKLYIF